MKKWIALALCLALTLSLAACGKQNAAQTPVNDDAAVSEPADEANTPDGDTAPDAAATPDNTATTPDAAAAPDNTATTPDAAAPDDTAATGEEVTVTNPFTDYDNYADAEAVAGFVFGVPEEIGGYDKVAYRVADDLSLFEVIYSNDTASLTARKAPGNWNISGDNNQYTQEIVQTLQGVDVTCWGDGNTLFLAMWTVDDYSYSLGADQSVDREDFLGVVETIIALNV